MIVQGDSYCFNELFLKIPALSSSAENSAVVFLERLVVKNVSNVCEQNRGPKRDVIQPIVTRPLIGQLRNNSQSALAFQIFIAAFLLYTPFFALNSRRLDVLIFHHEIFECSLDFKSGKVSNPSVKSFKHRLISLEIRLFRLNLVKF